MKIYCKLPNGIRYDLKNNEGKTEQVTLNGANHHSAVAGFGVTENVPKNTWEAIFALYGDTMPIVKGFVFASEKDGAREAAEKEELKTQFERIDPENLEIRELKNSKIKQASK